MAVLALSGAGVATGQQALLVLDQTAINLTVQQNAAAPAPVIRMVQSTGAALNYSVSASTFSGTPWLQVTPATGTTPSNVSISVNHANVPLGVHQGFVTVTSPGAGNIAQVTVNLNVTAGGASQVSPASLSFAFPIGSTTTETRTLNIAATGTGQTFTAQADVPWLTVSPSSGLAPNNVTVLANPSGLAQGTHNGSVAITISGLALPVTVPVALTLSPTPSIVVGTDPVRFNYQIDGTAPAQQRQTITVTSTGSTLTFSTGTVGGSWLVVTPSTGSTPGSVTIEANAGGLAAGTYQGVVTVTPVGAANGQQAIPVFLTVSTNPLLSVSPGALTFTHQLGGTPPPAQSITPSSTGAALNYQASANIPAGGNWLSVSPGAGATPSPMSVSVAPEGLGPGTYTGNISVSAPGAGNTPQVVPVTLKVTSEPQLQISAGRLMFAYQTGRTVPAAQVVTVSSTTTPLSFAAEAQTSSGGNWLSVSAVGGTTPAGLRVEVHPEALQPGSYEGSIVLTSPGAANSPAVLNVALFVSQNALITLSRANFIFTKQIMDQPELQQIAITSTGDPLQITVTPTVTSSPGFNWLIVSPVSGSTPQSINVIANPTGLPPGRYEARLDITGASSAGNALNSPESVPITLTVTSGTLNATPASLSFTQAAGGAAPAPQNVQVTSTGGAVNWTAVASMNIGQGWLSISPSSGSTPGAIAVSVNGSQLNPGTYTGAVTIVSPGATGSPRTVPVTLQVAQAQTLSLSPATLTFNAQQGGTPPATQQIAVTSSGAAANFTAAAATTSGGAWLSVSPASGATPGSLTVAANPQGLAAGSYSGTVTVTSPNAGNSPQTVNVTLVVAALPVPQVLGVVNAANFLPGAVAPGEIVTIGGTNLGPASGVVAEPQGGRIPTALSDVRVLFDGIPAPLLFVRADQINLVVPYAIAGRLSTRVQVESRGVASTALEIRVADTAPGVFTGTGTGFGQGAILNENYSVNSAANPAARGSVVAIYATGEGLVAPRPADGAIAPADPAQLWHPIAPVSVTIGGQRADVLYQGAAPGIVAGGMQINVRIPTTVSAGQLQLSVTMGTVSAQPGVTIAVQ